MEQPSTALLRTERLTKRWESTDQTGVRDVTVQIDAGEFVAICGPSGSGKSTLLSLLGALDRPTSGGVWLGPDELSTLGDAERADIRNRQIGYVFQSFQLLPGLSAVENVALPALIGREGRGAAYRRASELLGKVGLEAFAQGGTTDGSRPAEMSGGEQQRVSIARALVNDPSIVLADEPTGNLDQANGALVLDALIEATVASGRTLVMVTHDESIASRADRILRMLDGELSNVVATGH